MAKTRGDTPNRLKDEKSPYLRQHAQNPVDWYPWGDAALAKARKEDRPMLISIGYSSCHWCHVMERESFEDEETAKIMNSNFVNIKVDREERPDLDSLYMKAVQRMTGHAGWPLTVFATPAGVPFYGGSYFPPRDSHGLPSFKKVLLAVMLAYRKNREKVDTVTSEIENGLAGVGEAVLPLEAGAPENAFEAARLFFDPVNGGFGRGTKFPHSMFLRFLLDYHARTKEGEALDMLRASLTAMAEGGIYDHVGGGFHRYSVDERWDVPHFEKMLYDNALLCGLYALASKVVESAFYGDVAVQTVDYMLREMCDKDGGFYCAQDADVAGHEGAYYLWEYAELEKVLGKGDAQKFGAFYSATPEGNYDGANVLRINRGARPPGALVSEEIKGLTAKLRDARATREAPQTDRKIITAWNGLAIRALAEAGGALERDDFVAAAARCASFVLKAVKDGEGRLMRYYLDGMANVKGNLEDYALFADSLLALHVATGQGRWLEEARVLVDEMIRLFYEAGEGLFYDTGADQERLFVRERDLFDNDVPSGNSAAAGLLLRASRIFKDERYGELSAGILRSAPGVMDEPLSYGHLLCVYESMLAGG